MGGGGGVKAGGVAAPSSFKLSPLSFVKVNSINLTLIN